MTLNGRNGPIRLGDLLGKGGEGAVYALADDPHSVAKVYLADITRERTEKLAAMPGLLTKEIAALTAWPKDVLYKPDGRIGGFLMDRMGSSKDIHTLYSPKSRLAEFPHADWRLLVRVSLNLSRAFHILHQSGCLVADVNHGGIRVAPDGTVRIIDCDSFQISSQGKTYLCEVGTDQFTPPELQQKSFKQTPRTANHDNFGLAILIFQLLQMGRHPFAGRYRGTGEMPIPKAIGEFRYAYSGQVSLTQMEPPPYTASPHSASPGIAALWERAFSREGSNSQPRPTAAEWVAELSSLEKSLAQCAINPTHYHFRGNANCPWCPIESIGVILFGIATGTTTGGADIPGIWQQVLTIPNPGVVYWAPATAHAPVKPSPQATAARKKRTERRSIAVLAGVLLFFGLAFISGSLWFLWLIIATGVGFAIAYLTTDSLKPFSETHDSLDAQMTALVADYAAKPEAETFEIQRSQLTRTFWEWENLPDERKRRYDQLVKDREQHALRAHLDSHLIAKASIPNIGPGRKDMLESYGIETALDLNVPAILQVPGFGNSLAADLMHWRHQIEQQFRFNPAAEVDRAEVLALDRAIAIKRADLERKLRAAPALLNEPRQSVLNRRTSLEASLQQLSEALHQAKADLDALK
ncbi:hypothetical protein [Luteolibacter soli]|uniref:Protein kinase domain-containing protein n=1 Tax=Luteolibacter soli TaxID=3135280 RepID=A0ABU9AU40_9BACT